MSRKAAKKLKWTEQMNKDVLDCKRRAMEMISSGNPPRNENGRKRGYIEVMKRLWDEMGYEMLGIKAQNLRDQAARLEGLQESSEDTTLQESRATNDLGNIRPPTRITISDDQIIKIFKGKKGKMLISRRMIAWICILIHLLSPGNIKT